MQHIHTNEEHRAENIALYDRYAAGVPGYAIVMGKWGES